MSQSQPTRSPDDPGKPPLRPDPTPSEFRRAVVRLSALAGIVVAFGLAMVPDIMREIVTACRVIIGSGLGQ